MSVASSADMMQHILNGSNMGLQFDFNGILWMFNEIEPSTMGIVVPLIYLR